jgi:hypothetical protein
LLLSIANDYHAGHGGRELKRLTIRNPTAWLLGHCAETVGGIAFGAARVGFLLPGTIANRHIVAELRE